MEGDDFHGQLVLVGLFDLRELKWVDARGRGEGEVDVGAADGLGKGAILVFWVDDDDFGVEEE